MSSDVFALTTAAFFAISYIIIVNPLILADAGIPVELSVFATIFSSVIGCLLMAFVANAPIVLTPGMGINAFFTYTICVQMGLSWHEALAISVYCVLKHPDSCDDAIIASVNHRGDSDSTGAITGNIIGSALGLSAIPRKYLDHLELKAELLELADDLYADCRMDADGAFADPTWEAKYVRMDYSRTPRVQRH